MTPAALAGVEEPPSARGSRALPQAAGVRVGDQRGAGERDRSQDCEGGVRFMVLAEHGAPVDDGQSALASAPAKGPVHVEYDGIWECLAGRESVEQVMQVGP